VNGARDRHGASPGDSLGASPGDSLGASPGGERALAERRVTLPPRFAHGSRVPGWDEAVDLDKAPAGVPDPLTTPVPEELRAQIEEYMSRYPDHRSAALPALKAAQRVHGWCSPEAIEQVAAVMRVTPASLEALATFYDMLDTSPAPVEHHDVYVCTNISCSLRGADALYAAALRIAGDAPDVNLRSFECLGACEMAPMASVDGTYVGPLEEADLHTMIADLRARRPVLPDKQLAARPCADAAGADHTGADHNGPGDRAGGPAPQASGDTAASADARPPKLLLAGIDEPELATLAVYERRGGYEALRKALSMAPEEVLAQLEASGLRGRGGAGFQMAKKISFLPKGASEKYLVCNADESEPGTFKDRELMQKCPHMLIEGIVIAAHAAEISRAFVYVRGEYSLQADILERALREARDAGFVGERIMGTERAVDIVVHRGAGAYICGEETGLLDSLEGKRGNPRLKPPFPAIQGLYDGPTLINNVETIATTPAILRIGGEAYAKLGTETSTGTKVVSVSGHVLRPGNYEIELGIPARDIVYGLAGGPPAGRAVKCWFPGGSSAPVLGPDELDLAYDFDTLAKAGTMLGSGAIIVVDDSTPILDVALKVAKFYAHESCGKCTPCREGTSWTVKMLQRIGAGEATPVDLEIIAGVQENITGNCLCVLGDAMAMPIASIITRFRDELEEHIERARDLAAARARPRAGGEAALAAAQVTT
jgi:NADH-quinone oxidoreductase subunit F